MHLDFVVNSCSTIDRLKALLSVKTLSHLYIFVAPAEEVASITAKAFLLDWLDASSTQECHPDLFELCCSGKAGLHSVNKIREIIEEIALTSYASKGKAILIHSAERMLPSSSNAILKVLEEPPPRTIILLATSALQKILPTIISRAQIIRLSAVMQESTLDLQPVLNAPSYKSIHAFSESISKIVEEEKQSLEKELIAQNKEYLLAAARYEFEQDIEASLTLFYQKRAKKLLEEAYLSLRTKIYHDPHQLTYFLLQALKAIERGSDLKRIFSLFLADAIFSKAC